MSKPFLDLDPIAVKAELWGILKFIPRKSDMCQHVTCGFIKGSSRYDWSSNKTVVIKRGQEAKCTWERYSKCTTQELSNPDAKAGSIFAAIMVHVIHKGAYGLPNTSAMVFLHDLYTDQTKDKWFQMGSHEGTIQPNIQVRDDYPLPSKIVNLHDVIEGMKKAI